MELVFILHSSLSILSISRAILGVIRLNLGVLLSKAALMGNWGAEPCIWHIWSFYSVILVITLVLVCSLAFMEIHYVFWGKGLLIFARVICLRGTYISCSNTLSWFQNVCPVWSFCYYWHELLLTFAGRIIALFIVTFFLFF